MTETAQKPLFAIITVTFRAENTVERTLESVDSQSFQDYEHLIIDGASTDRTLELIANHDNPRRRVVSEPDRGLYDAMNKGIGFSSGRYLIFLNAGDKFHSTDSLRQIAEAIEANNTPGVVYGQTIIVDNSGAQLGERHLRAPQNLTLQSFATGMVVCHQAFVALREISGFYDLKYRFSADYEWCIRCLQHSRKNVGLTDTVLIDYLSEGVTTANHLPSLRERFSIMCTYYGVLPTICRHFGFALRWLKRRKNKTNRQ